MLRPPAAVLFDVDGTLLHTRDAYYEIFTTVLGRMGIDPPPPTLVAEVMNFGVSPLDRIYPPDRPGRAEWLQRYFALSREVWPEALGRVLPLPHVPAVLAALSAAGTDLAIVTASQGRVLEPLRRLGLDRHFRVAITRADVEQPKPAPDGVLAALERLGVAAEDAVLVGDTPMDIQCGQAAGVRTIAVASGTADQVMLSQYKPDLVLPDLAGLLSALGLPVPSGPLVGGEVRRGLREATGFTGIPWVEAALAEMLGAAPFPGTLNLTAASAADQAAWAALRARAGLLLPAQVPGFCAATCHPVQVGDRVPGLVLVPHVTDYPADKIEVVAPVHLGDCLGLSEGDRVTLLPMAI